MMIRHKIEDEAYEEEYRQQKNKECIKQTVESIKKNTDNISKENIQDPNPSILYPAVYELVPYLHEKEIRELFSKLIASSYDKSKTEYLHPGFIGIIKQLSPYDARLLSSINKLSSITGYIAINKYTKVEYKLIDIPELKEDKDVFQLSLSLDNLMRLGLINIEKNIEVPVKSRDGNLIKLHSTSLLGKEDTKYYDILQDKYDICSARAYLTVLGVNFLKVCVN